MSRFILREDGSQLLRENGTPYLREDGALSLQLSESLNLSAVGKPSPSVSISLSGSLGVNAVGRKVPSASLSLSESLGVSLTASPQRSTTASISSSFAITINSGTNAPNISETVQVSAVGSSARLGSSASVSESSALAVTGRKVVGASAALSLPAFTLSATASSTRNATASISETFSVLLRFDARITETLAVSIAAPDLRPIAPTKFKSVRSGSDITLTWADPFGAATIEVYRSQGQREPFSLLATLNTGVQTYSDNVTVDAVASYQLKPIAPNGAKGKSSYIIYNAPNSQIL